MAVLLNFVYTVLNIMIIFDQEKLSAFFDKVSRGFEHSPLEMVLVIVSFLAFVALLIVIYRLQRRTVRRKQRRLAEGRYRQIAGKQGLTPSEEDLVGRMARYLKEPEKKYLILINQHTFNYCASRLRQREPVRAGAVAQLRNRLGFRLQGSEQIATSSAELPQGQGLLLVGLRQGNGPKAQGRVQEQAPSSLVVQLIEPSAPFRAGEPLRVYFQNRAGLFSFESRILAIHRGGLELEHGEGIKRIQRRKYYRRRIFQPVKVRPAGTEEQAELSNFYDLGGNGASLKNPGKRYKSGDALELSFMAAGERFSLVAEVLRSSKNGEVLHVRFAPMRESTRDRIIGALFSGASPIQKRS
jgi:hypothetical protein